MIKNKKIAIVGLGKEGLAAANCLSPQNEVFIFDVKAKTEIEAKFFDSLENPKSIQYFLGGSLPKEQDFDLIVRSPGIRPEDKLIKSIKSKNTLVTTGTQIFFEQCPGEIIGVTGTKGKGTTSTLIFEMVKAKTQNVFIAGNIGTPALEILPKLNSESIVILELSSFQLLDLQKSPYVAVVLMTTTEHLDWHTGTEEYVQAKANITKYQTAKDFAVINADYPNSLKIGNKSKGKIYLFSAKKKVNGAYVSEDKIISKIDGEKQLNTRDILIPGAHNFQNVMAAVCAAQILKVDMVDIKKVVSNFKGLKHRLQLVRTIENVSFYNDSFSTTPETAIAAISAFDKPKIIILGGSTKNSDFSALAKVIIGDDNIKAVILIGVESERLQKSIEQAGTFKGKIIKGSKNMAEIVKEASDVAKDGDVVILSPACASFDMFKNYEERGEEFISQVNKLT